MTGFDIQRLPFSREGVSDWMLPDGRHANWPVVYTLNDESNIYVGETLNAVVRMRQHLDSSEKSSLTAARIVLDETFNKSVCLDLESYLIRLFAGDGRYVVLNRNEGISNADYFDRQRYQEAFNAIFEQLRAEGMFTRDIHAIENSDLFKLSPFKALNQEQAIAIEGILEGLFADLEEGAGSTIVVQGDPGTGKTIVGIFLMKLLRDIQLANPHEKVDSDAIFSDFFLAGYPELLQGFKIGLVVPQQSLRKSIEKVFQKTPGLTAAQVLTPFEVGASDEHYDLLIVDETHRLNQRANQASAVLNQQFSAITQKLFGADDFTKSQLDWVKAKSRHQIFLLDSAQRVRPADLPTELLNSLVVESTANHRFYRLASQMRIRAGSDYIAFVRQMLSGKPAVSKSFLPYDLRFFDDLGLMREAIHAKDAEAGLARLVAGFAWPWKTKKDRDAYDIDIDGCRLRWNQQAVDWINSAGSLDEVGSIHTVQGYDLNFAGVIIGPDLKFDPVQHRLFVDRSSYFDTRGKQNNKTLGLTFDDEDLLGFITNIYSVLLTRGMRGTYVYVCDPGLREHLRGYFG